MVSVTADDPKIRAIENYLYGIEHQDIELALEQFTEDAGYYHPPMGDRKRGIEGKDSIREFFEDRGDPDIDHELDERLSGDGTAIILGRLFGDDVIGDEDIFVAYAEFEGDQMSYYYTISPQFLREGYYTQE